MKKLLILLISAFVNINTFSQDIITLKNGDEIKSKVLEISSDQIKYKKWENIDGTTYSSLKTEVFMIKYQNGEKDVFNNTSSENISSTKNAEANAPEIAKNFIAQKIKTNSNSIMILKNFKKTNGVIRDYFGQKIYEIEYELDVEFLSGGYAKGNNLIGYFGNFSVVKNAPSSMYGANTDEFGNNYVYYPQGQYVRFTGTVTLANTGNGYIGNEYKIKNYKKIDTIVQYSFSSNNKNNQTENLKETAPKQTTPILQSYVGDLKDGRK